MSRTWKVPAALGAVLVLLLGTAQAAAPNDPYYSLQWNLKKVNIEQAWGLSTGAGTTIAIVDSGVDLTHQDLIHKLVPGIDIVGGDAFPQDEFFHGTFVAGVAAAETNNGAGIAGAARDAKIMPVRVAGTDGSASEIDVSSGILWAVDHGANVINISLGRDFLADPNLPALDPALAYAFANGVLVVAAAGNTPKTMCDYPALSPTVVCVAASANTNPDTYADFSSRGARVDVLAPGVDIPSTYWTPSSPNSHTAYATGDGTSFASPLVAGIGAMLMSAGASNLIARRALTCAAKDLGPAGFDSIYGWGRVDALAAMKALTPGTGCASPPFIAPAPTIPPTPIPSPTVPPTPHPTVPPTPIPSPTVPPTPHPPTIPPTPIPTPSLPEPG